MKMVVTGYDKVDYVSKKTGNPVKALNVFGVVKDQQSPSMVGEKTTSVWIPYDSPHYPTSIMVGDVATVYYNEFKGIDFFQLAQRKAGQ